MSTSGILVIQRAKRTSTFLLLLLTLGLSGMALASGGGHYSNGSSGTPKLDSRLYALGKQVYKNRVNCADCLVDQSRLSKQDAAALYKQVKRDKALNQSLSRKERKAVKYYMRERFKL